MCFACPHETLVCARVCACSAHVLYNNDTSSISCFDQMFTVQNNMTNVPKYCLLLFLLISFTSETEPFLFLIPARWLLKIDGPSCGFMPTQMQLLAIQEIITLRARNGERKNLC